MNESITKSELKRASKIAERNMAERLAQLKVNEVNFYRALMAFRQARMFTPNLTKEGKPKFFQSERRRIGGLR